MSEVCSHCYCLHITCTKFVYFTFRNERFCTKASLCLGETFECFCVVIKSKKELLSRWLPKFIKITNEFNKYIIFKFRRHITL
jgi:hypothetical protein